MRNFLLSICCVFSLSAFAQNAPAPEFNNKVMFVEANNTLTELEKTDMNSDLHTNMGGHSEVNLVANGKTASLSHSGKPTDKYVVKIDPGTDPANVVELFIFEVGKKNRKILVAEMSLGKNKTVELTKAKLSFKKIGEGIYEITTLAQLESGEYCFLVNRPAISIMGSVNSTALVGYCFSVK